MATAFLRINEASLVLLILTILFSIGNWLGFDLRSTHALTGLLATVVGMFGLVAIMFFVMATGGYMKESLKGDSLEKDFIKRIAGIKMRLYPWCILEISLLIATAVAGGGLLAGAPVYWYHLGLAVATIGVYLKTISATKIDFAENRVMLEAVYKKAGKKSSL